MTNQHDFLEELKSLRKLDSEAAEYVETVIIARCPQFTGELPYVGWKGLGLALNERLDELEESMEVIRNLLDIIENRDQTIAQLRRGARK